MATRTQKILECDRAGCRNRKGVRPVSLTLEIDIEEIEGLPDVPGTMVGGDLCPYHLAMAETFLDNLFKNTKPYDDPDGKDAPSGTEA